MGCEARQKGKRCQLQLYLYFFTILSLLNCSKDKSVSADLAMIAEPMIAAKTENYNAPPPLAEIKLVNSAAVSVNESSPNSLKPTNQNAISKQHLSKQFKTILSELCYHARFFTATDSTKSKQR